MVNDEERRGSHAKVPPAFWGMTDTVALTDADYGANMNLAKSESC